MNAAASPSGVELPRIAISTQASVAIDTWAWGLADGSLRLWQLPDAINTLWGVAYEQGRRSRDAEVHLLKIDADRLWLRAFGDSDRQQYLLDRLDRAADLANRPDVDDVLDEAWQIYLASLDNIREPIRLTPTQNIRKEVA
ncbi:hypothetical protein [Microbacterium foliorum]|uniref:hypothetical protein n=1 Tax=Microbacterium foliorum TaxID=104336 RepID=UPI0009A0561F|nr:hypothetical protein [Microbacterium foliorum]AQY01608.1 hypothetical protein B2G67_09110 [Microbacterium foliorum]